MKFQTIVVLFVAVASAYKPLPTCKAPSSACKYVSKSDAKECRKLFAQRYVDIKTCWAPARTVTSTRTVCQTTVTTKTLKPPATTTKVFVTTTKTGKPTTRPTTTLTATSTQIDKTTLTDTTTSTEFDIVTETETETETLTDTETTTATSTTTLGWEPPTCQGPIKRAVSYGSNKYKKPLPAKCSCFLTTTKPGPVVTATVTTKKRPITRTVYKVGGPRPTVKRTITITRYTAGPTLSAPETTITITRTITQTDRTLTTVTEEQVSTSTATITETQTDTTTSTASATATATQGACNNLAAIRYSDRSFSHPNVVLSSSGQAIGEEGVRFCCNVCFNSKDCVYFRVANNFCQIFFTRNNVINPCTSDECRRGLSPVIVGPADGHDYYLGECIGARIQQN
ncbi:hypothetical protein ACJ41O_001632 [Fusarium nematophilum]